MLISPKPATPRAATGGRPCAADGGPGTACCDPCISSHVRCRPAGHLPGCTCGLRWHSRQWSSVRPGTSPAGRPGGVPAGDSQEKRLFPASESDLPDEPCVRSRISLSLCALRGAWGRLRPRFPGLTEGGSRGCGGGGGRRRLAAALGPGERQGERAATRSQDVCRPCRPCRPHRPVAMQARG